MSNKNCSQKQEPIVTCKGMSNFNNNCAVEFFIKFIGKTIESIHFEEWGDAANGTKEQKIVFRFTNKEELAVTSEIHDDYPYNEEEDDEVYERYGSHFFFKAGSKNKSEYFSV